MLMRLTILAGLALVLLGGCGSDDEGGGGGGEPAAQLTGPLTYERGGGIAGRRDRLVVQPDGSAQLTVREKTTQVKVPGNELDTLARDLEKANLASLPRDSTTKPPVPDTFAYRVSYDGSTVTTDDPGMPDGLGRLVARLGALVERLEKG
jgi:hypothetical protein